MRVLAVVLLAAACAAVAAIGGELLEFREAAAFRNGAGCADAPTIHIAMTLDATYLRGSLAGVLFVLRHAACPESIAFHFVASSANPARCLTALRRALAAAFPTLPATVHRFDTRLVRGKISASVRRALDQPEPLDAEWMASGRGKVTRDLPPVNQRIRAGLDTSNYFQEFFG